MNMLDDTLNKNAKLQSYLIVDDNKDEPIKPAFYSFGSGEFKVKVRKHGISILHIII